MQSPNEAWQSKITQKTAESDFQTRGDNFIFFVTSLAILNTATKEIIIVVISYNQPLNPVIPVPQTGIETLLVENFLRLSTFRYILFFFDIKFFANPHVKISFFRQQILKIIENIHFSFLKILKIDEKMIPVYQTDITVHLICSDVTVNYKGMLELKTLPRQNIDFFCKVCVILVAQNYKCFYTVKEYMQKRIETLSNM